MILNQTVTLFALLGVVVFQAPLVAATQDADLHYNVTNQHLTEAAGIASTPRMRHFRNATNNYLNINDTIVANSTPHFGLGHACNCTCLQDASFSEIFGYLFKRFIGPNWGKVSGVSAALLVIVVGVVCVVSKCKNRRAHQNQSTNNSARTDVEHQQTSDFSTQSSQGTLSQNYPTKLPLESSLDASGIVASCVPTTACSEFTTSAQEFRSDRDKLLAEPFQDLGCNAATTSELPPPVRHQNENGGVDNPAFATNSCTAASTRSMQDLISAMTVLETCLWNLENSTVNITSELIKKFGQAFYLSVNQISTCESNAKTTTEFLVNVFRCMHNKIGREFTPEKMVDYFRANEMILLAEVLEETLAGKGYVINNT